MNIYSFDGLLAFVLLLICTCAYLRRIPRLKSMLLSEKKGFAGIFYKFSIIGTRLHIPVAISCALMAFYIMFVR